MSTNGVNGSNGHHDEDGEVDVDDPELQSYFTERNGRRYHTGTSPYPLPLDNLEVQRFVTEHNIIRDVLGHLYITPDNVRQVLSDNGVAKNVVDLATGNGKWIRDMAAEFPHVDFHGVDIVPLAPRNYLENVYFELDDIRNQTREPATVDVVHIRSAFMATSEYGRIVQEAARILKPEGLLLATEWQQSISIQPGAPFPPGISTMVEYVPNLCRFYSTLHTALRNRNLNADVPAHLSDVVNAFPQLFHAPVHAEGHFVPIGTWSGTEQGRHIGNRMRAVVRRYMDSCRHLLAGELSEDAVDGVIAGSQAEMDMERSGLCLVFQAVAAVRRS